MSTKSYKKIKTRRRQKSIIESDSSSDSEKQKIINRRRQKSIIESDSSSDSEKKKIKTRRRQKSIIESESSSESVDNENVFDGSKHFTKINVKKYATYKQGNFKNKNMKTFAKSLDIYNLKYTEIASRFSIRPKKKLCVFSGLPSMFICPYTRLPYYDSSIYKHLKTLTSDSINFIYETKDMCKNFNPFNK